MKNLANELAFVKDQILAQEKMMLKYVDQPKRVELHALTKMRFENLLQTLNGIVLEDAMRLPTDGAPGQRHENHLSGIHLSLADIEGAPPELMAELNISETDRQEMLIADIIAKAGEYASLDKIIVLFHKRTGDVIKRNTMTSKLYRMAEKGMIFNVPGKRGVYSTYEMSEDQAAKIFGRPASDPPEEEQPSIPEHAPSKATAGFRAAPRAAVLRAGTSMSTPAMGSSYGVRGSGTDN